MVDQLAEDYAGQPVIFLEYDVDNPPGNRYAYWWTAYGSGSVTLPMVMVDSGHQISNGYEPFASVYRDMVERARSRPPGVRLVVARERISNRFRFEVRVTNLGEVTLSSSNIARVHAIVYEDAHVADTNRFIRGARSTGISSLAAGATETYTIEVSLSSELNWDKLHSVVLVDYRPGVNTGTYDMLQAAHQQ